MLLGEHLLSLERLVVVGEVMHEFSCNETLESPEEKVVVDVSIAEPLEAEAYEVSLDIVIWILLEFEVVKQRDQSEICMTVDRFSC